MKSSYTSTYYVCVFKLCYVACRRPVYVCAARLAQKLMESISRYTILTVWDCVRRKSKLKWSAGSPPEVRNQLLGQTRLSVYATKNCRVRPGSRVESYLFAGAEKASQTRLAGLVICVYIGGKRRVLTRLSGRTRELGLSVNAISLSLKPLLTLFPLGYFEDLSPLGGGADLAPPPQISATNGPIDSKIGTVVKQVK